jgi:hypothetical protein
MALREFFPLDSYYLLLLSTVGLVGFLAHLKSLYPPLPLTAVTNTVTL